MSAREVLEVSTFRAAQTGEDATDEHGRLLSDNVYGSQAEDAARRDFTINALYFDPATEEIWDYVGGVADVARAPAEADRPAGHALPRGPGAHAARACGSPPSSALAIDAKTAAPIPKLAPLIQNVPPARLFDEMQKLLLSGHAVETLKSLRAHGLHHGLLPLLDVILEQPLGSEIHRCGARQHRRARARRQAASRPRSCSRRCCGTRCWRRGTRPRRAARQPLPALFDAMDQRARAAGAAHRDPAPLRGDDQGDLVAAAALRAARGRAPVAAARASALSRRLRLPGAARRRAARWPQALVDWWTRFQDAGDQRARGDAASPTRRRRSAGARAAAAAKRRDDDVARRTRRTRNAADGDIVARSPMLDRRVRRPGQQPRPPPPAARPSAWRRSRRLPLTRIVVRPPTTLTAPSALRRRAARLRQRGGAARTALRPRALLRATAGDRAPARTRRAPPARATRRARSTSICYYTAAFGSHAPLLTLPHPRMHERAFVLQPLLDVAPAIAIPGHGLARRALRAVRRQRMPHAPHRVSNGRTLAATQATTDRPATMDLDEMPLHRRRGADRRWQDQPRARAGDAPRRRDAARAARGQSVPRRASTRTCRASRCRRNSLSCSSAPTSCAACRSSTCSGGRRWPISCSTRTRCSRGSTCPTTNTRLYEKVYAAPQAADAHARPGDLPAGAGGYTGRARAAARRRLRAGDSRRIPGPAGRCYTRFFYLYDEAPLPHHQQRTAQFRRRCRPIWSCCWRASRACGRGANSSTWAKAARGEYP